LKKSTTRNSQPLTCTWHTRPRRVATAACFLFSYAPSWQPRASSTPCPLPRAPRLVPTSHWPLLTLSSPTTPNSTGQSPMALRDTLSGSASGSRIRTCLLRRLRERWRLRMG
ncbi:hypothetical protein BC936DRAFT_138783, partial [Jimgerdemannia flammicorona]